VHRIARPPGGEVEAIRHRGYFWQVAGWEKVLDAVLRATSDAVLRSFIAIGEAVKQSPAELTELHAVCGTCWSASASALTWAS
jgi:hypothetical protein